MERGQAYSVYWILDEDGYVTDVVAMLGTKKPKEPHRLLCSFINEPFRPHGIANSIR